MVDAVDLLLVEHVEDNLIDCFCRSEIPPKWLLDDDARPGIRRYWARNAGTAQLLDDVRINFRRRGKVEETVPAQVLGSLQFRQALAKLRVGFRVGIVSGRIIKVGSKSVPLFGVNRPDLGNRFRSFPQTCAEGVLGHIGAGKSDDGVARAECVVRGQVIHRGNDFALSEVSRRSKQNHGARFRHSAVHRTGTTCLPSHRVSFFPFSEAAYLSRLNRAALLYLNPVFF